MKAFVGRNRVAVCVLLTSLASACSVAAQPNGVDYAGYTDGGPIQVTDDRGLLEISWPVGERSARLRLQLAAERPLIETLTLAHDDDARGSPILASADPVFFVTVGSRRTPEAKPDWQQWQVFFDKPANRPHETYRGERREGSAEVVTDGRRLTVVLPGYEAGPFSGRLELTVYEGSPLLHWQAVLSTGEDRRAIIYDAGLVSEDDTWQRFSWIDPSGRGQSRTADSAAARPVAVRYRHVIAQTHGGTVACLPPPHQFQFPRDWTDNYGFTWIGSGFHGLEQRSGFGIRQDPEKGRAFVPWFNAPPDVEHRLGMFVMFDSGPSSAGRLRHEVRRLTHNDTFPELPGYKTLTSHWHMAIAITAMEQGLHRERPMPEYARVFQEMGVNLVHLGEFHGDGHQKDPGPLRLPEMQAMFHECRQWSDEDLLLIPGEEVNTFLGLRQEGRHPGHWMSFFPRPVYWTMQREADQPFVEEIAPYGRVYHVGSRGDMIRLLREEDGLAWSAHPRIKASSWTPDIFRHEDFFLADFWLGAAWKSLPSDLSYDRLGPQPLDLLDDMCNWGHRKFLPGEVDVFKIDRTHELYSHMNVNYLKLDRVPEFDEGWHSVRDALRGGRFFVTTGEVMLEDFQVSGVESGGIVSADEAENARLTATLSWTFPLAYAEIISGDGEQVFRERLPLTDTVLHGRRQLIRELDLSQRRWVRFEVWDVATNGAFTQPIWIEP